MNLVAHWEKKKAETKVDNLVFQLVEKWVGLKVAKWVEMTEKTMVEN